MDVDAAAATKSGRSPRGQVLLSTYNGGEYLRQQLESLLRQTIGNVAVLVRDDGSGDDTRAILEEYRSRGFLAWHGGEHMGAALSFWQLLADADDADFYAFCDQDDVWDADKLEVAVAALMADGDESPALYCSDVRVADAQLHAVSEHLVRPMPVDYSHALVRNMAPGCTFVFNRAAKDVMCRYDARALGVDLHDWTAFKIVSCFGRVVFDQRTHMSYRQHDRNAIGAPSAGIGVAFGKARRFWSGPMRNSRELGAQRLEQAFLSDMPAAHAELTADFAHYRQDRTRKRRLLRWGGAGLPAAERVLFRLLVLFNRL